MQKNDFRFRKTYPKRRLWQLPTNKQLLLAPIAIIALFYGVGVWGPSWGAQPSRALAADAARVVGAPTVPTVPTLPTVPSVTSTATATETSVDTPTATATPTATSTESTATPTSTATATPTATATGTIATATATPTTTPTTTTTPILAIKQYYISSASNGKIDELRFNDEDILLYDIATDKWSLFFDGSDVGVGRTDIDAFFINSDGSILMSFVHPVNFPAPLGKVDDSDIVRFIPSQLGTTTAGTFELYFDGSDVGLTTGNEDIDAFGFTPDGRLLISTYGRVEVPSINGRDEDILVFTATSLGDNTQGTWSIYFDGSDVELTQGSEDVQAFFVQAPSGEIYLLTRGNYVAVGTNTVSGDFNDIFRCTPQSLGETTGCTFANVFNGDSARFFYRIDAFAPVFGPVAATDVTTVQSAATLDENLPQYEVDEDDLDFTDEDVDEFDDAQEGQNSRLLLPIIDNDPVVRDEPLPLP